MITRAAHPALSLIVGAAAFMVLVFGLRRAGPLLIPLLLSALLAVLFQPVVRWLVVRRIPRVAAVVGVVIALHGLFLGCAALVSGPISAFVAAAPEYEQRIEEFVGQTSQRLDALGVDTSALDLQQAIDPGGLVRVLASSLARLSSTVSTMLMSFLVLIFVLLEEDSLADKLRKIAGGAAIEQLGTITHQVRRYLAVKTAASLGTGVCVGAWTAMAGLSYPVVWGLIAFLLNYIPSIGSIVAAVPAVLVALLDGGIGRALLVGAGYFVVNVVFGNVVEPSLQGRAMGISTLVVLLSLVFWGWVWGIVGMLLAVPLTMVVKIAAEHTPGLAWLAVLLSTRAQPEATGETAG